MSQKPVFKTSLGAIQCSVWENTSADGSQIYHSIDIVRVYKDSQGNWQTTSSIKPDELLNVGYLAKVTLNFISNAKQGG